MNLTDQSLRASGVVEQRIDSSGSNVLLKFDRTNRVKSPALLLFIMLSFAVFVWGVQYKLSLYHSEIAQRAIPAAKLLSQKERLSFSTQLESLLLPGRPLPTTPSKQFFPTHISQQAPAQLAVSIRLERELRVPTRSRATESYDIDLSPPRAPPIAA
jgi:hypothetical protein